MSDIKRYTFAGAAGLYVYEADFNAALAREAALQARLNVADQRVDDLQQQLTAPVPPACGEPEVVAVIDQTDSPFPETAVIHRPGIESLPVGTELVDRAHATRLQAEVERLARLEYQSREALKVANQHTKQVIAERDALIADVEDVRRRTEMAEICFVNASKLITAQESELTKARELLAENREAMRQYEKDCDEYPPFHHNRMIDRVDAYLARQSAPAAKDGE